MDRAAKGFRSGVVMVLSVAVPVFLLFFLGGRPIVELFMSEGGEKAAQVGVDFLRIVSPFYVVISLKLIADGVLRGAGAMKAFMIATFSDLILRVILAFLLSGIWKETGIWLSWPIGWVIGTALSVGFYLSGTWKKQNLID